ncbi:hypothetical protein Sjap_001919 [Stephania japonica]|uniref:Uncharacterized protein n=1 Tax=Stephania japonica TaxID=461633 RepID=A0AAP0KN65_9MAGN
MIGLETSQRGHNTPNFAALHSISWIKQLEFVLDVAFAGFDFNSVFFEPCLFKNR